MKIVNFYLLLSIIITLLVKSTEGYWYGNESSHYTICFSNPRHENEDFKEHIESFINVVHDLILENRDTYHDPSVLEQMERNFYSGSTTRPRSHSFNNDYEESPFVHFIFTVNYESCILAYLTHDLAEEIKYMPNVISVTTDTYSYMNYEAGVQGGFIPSGASGHGYGYGYIAKMADANDYDLSSSIHSPKIISYESGGENEDDPFSRSSMDTNIANSCIIGDACNVDYDTYLKSVIKSKPKSEPEPEPKQEKNSFNMQHVISERSTERSNHCWSEKLGYPCCTGCVVFETDSHGQWGVENNNWCGIIADQC